MRINLKKNKILTVIFFLQIIVTFIVLFVIYMLLALIDNDDLDIINFSILAIIQPIYASVFCLITILICLIIGLPLRLNNFLNKFWSSRPLLSILGIIISFFLLTLSHLPVFTNRVSLLVDNKTVLKQVPNIYLALSGWFLCAFSLLNFCPISLIAFIKNKFIQALVVKK